jgi:SAM-dependent methyltransferase
MKTDMVALYPPGRAKANNFGRKGRGDRLGLTGWRGWKITGQARRAGTMSKAGRLIHGMRRFGWRLEDLGRGCLRALRGGVLDEPLSAGACRAALELLDAPEQCQRGEPFRCRLRVRNLGPVAWGSRGRRPVLVAVRWLTEGKEDVGLPETRLALPCGVPPGEEVVCPLRLHAPESLGDFLMEIDLVQLPGTRFQEQGSLPLRLPCRVGGRPADNIDYRRWYAGQDLGRDYWSIVGPTDVKTYRLLGTIKLRMLRDLGLRPDARVLDVGCGTGQLAAALADFLGEQGAYHGTDIAPEAVAFCRARFGRTSSRAPFAFHQNGPTSIPVQGEGFDFVAFFSVLTHTFPDETVLLLGEARRLLAKNGVILADLFVSPLVREYAGNRGAVEVGEQYILGRVQECGLRAEVVERQRWGAFGERVFFKLTRAYSPDSEDADRERLVVPPSGGLGS